MSLRVLEPGLHTLVVDFGRPQWRSLGVPLGGAADRWSLAMGNALVGNRADAAALEISLTGPILEATCELGCILYGAPFALSSESQTLLHGKTFTLQAGERLRIGGTSRGMRCYLCVAGGFDSELILGSRTRLQPIQAGEELGCTPSRIAARFLHTEPRIDNDTPVLRVLPGAQAAWFEPQAFTSHEYTVTPASNRMGLRLRGPTLAIPPRELISEPVCPGAVQVTRDGQCILLGVDGQTIGGYPKIAQVISADLDQLGQLRPGQAIRFVWVTLEEAEQLYAIRQDNLRRWLLRLGVAV